MGVLISTEWGELNLDYTSLLLGIAALVGLWRLCSGGNNNIINGNTRDNNVGNVNRGNNCGNTTASDHATVVEERNAKIDKSRSRTKVTNRMEDVTMTGPGHNYIGCST